MNMALRIVVISGGLLLFLSLRLTSALRLDRVLLTRFGGRRAAGAHRPGISWDN
jgi:hypothetical protein